MIFPKEYNSPAISGTLFPQRKDFNDNNLFLLTGEGSSEISRPIQFFQAEEKAPTIVLFPAPDAELPSLEELAEGLQQQQINLLVIASEPWSEKRKENVCLKNYADNGAILADMAHSFLQDKRVDGALFIAGHGLGILPAITAMLRHNSLFKGIFLEGAICDLPNLLIQKGAVATKENIDNAPYLQELERVMQLISKPTMIFHGAKDPFSTANQAEKLQSASGARKKQFFIIPGAGAPNEAPLCHWAGPLYFSTVRSFIDTTCGSNTWRQRRRERKQQ